MIYALSLTAVLFTAAPVPTAEEQATLLKARELFKSGNTLYAQGRYAAALARFEETWAVRPHPSIQFNLGKCHEQLGDVPQALRAYREYLRLAPDSSDRETVFDSISRLERKLREKGLQQLTVDADQPNAVVSVDGQLLGAAPATAALPVGEHQLLVTAVGFESYQKKLQLQLAQPMELTVALRAVQAPAVVADAPRVEPVVAKPPPVLSAPPPTLSLTPEPKVRSRTWTWVAGGVAVAGVGVASGLMIGAGVNAQKLNTLAPDRDRPSADTLYGNYQTMTTGSEIAWAVAGTAAVTTLILFFVEK